MKVKKLNIAIIPARYGSKRIKHKNIKKFITKPIILHVIDLLKKSKFFDLIVVSSDSKKILDIAERGGANYLINRPKELANDKADTKSVILHSIKILEKKFELENIFCTYPTSIFLTSKIIIKAFELEKKTKNFIFGACSYDHPIQRSFKKNIHNNVRLNFPKQISKRTQDLKKNYHDAGQFYLASKDNWLKTRSIISNKSNFIELSRFECQDIDTHDDWKFAEILYKNVK
jgi:N-acylneuraminate cytidylyltransferase